ncbi:RING finger [Aspergillus sclerotialis]|uniref:RING finger n=1 Tax=Aspergillus sclerotialis TaxID=2070753 RepID=A0A3A3AB77_9EURO|nr:RING finger [Aspergillus sclerotialis]
MDLHDEPRWQWPQSSTPLNSHSEGQPSEDTPRPSDSYNQSHESYEKHYPSRECRICLESVLPTFQPPSDTLPEFLQPKARVVYESSDPELGRLLRPCKCKGSSRYVHEGCLQKWRHADPDYSKRNYWQCPTCGFQYRLERLTWAHWISSTWTQIILTLGILLSTVFMLGFIADPIINLYLDPLETIYYTEFWEPSALSDAIPRGRAASWFEHLVKGLASLGVLSFVKVIFALSPWQWWLRPSGVVSSGRTTGRSRVASVGWVVILVGVGSFLWAVYKGVRTWSRKALEKAGERVMDVPLPDDDADEVPVSNGEEKSKKDQ